MLQYDTATHQYRDISWSLFVTIPYPTGHEFEGTLRHSNQSHAVVDSTWTQAPLGNLEAPPFTEDEVLPRDADIREVYLSMSRWGVVETEHGEGANDFNSGGFHGDEDHGLLGVSGGGRIRLAHKDADLAARIHCSYQRINRQTGN